MRITCQPKYYSFKGYFVKTVKTHTRSINYELLSFWRKKKEFSFLCHSLTMHWKGHNLITLKNTSTVTSIHNICWRRNRRKLEMSSCTFFSHFLIPISLKDIRPGHQISYVGEEFSFSLNFLYFVLLFLVLISGFLQLVMISKGTC